MLYILIAYYHDVLLWFKNNQQYIYFKTWEELYPLEPCIHQQFELSYLKPWICVDTRPSTWAIQSSIGGRMVSRSIMRGHLCVRNCFDAVIDTNSFRGTIYNNHELYVIAMLENPMVIFMFSLIEHLLIKISCHWYYDSVPTTFQLND